MKEIYIYKIKVEMSGNKFKLDNFFNKVYTEIMARTIDNLGIEISNRYAEDQSTLDEKLIKESRQMPFAIGIDSTSPSFSQEFTLLFGLELRGARIALFLPPLGYFAQRRRLFTNQLMPILGSEEKIEAQELRIKGIPSSGEDEEESKQGKQDQEETLIPIFADTVKKEKRILLNLLSLIHKYDQDLIDINSRRSQYHKG